MPNLHESAGGPVGALEIEEVGTKAQPPPKEHGDCDGKTGARSCQDVLMEDEGEDAE